ncbi:radical SAM protein [Cryobacterium sp. TMT1-21]|uniref:Radical SAM protein n=1 Tax=Cryobacterium shii TaxID=1259235 RepID=A0AAQ2HFX9_9MICO|nr:MULTISPECIES: Rv2578c family radical SAM protein [Cryobacterium]TFC47176.1 radical SAM protein [Cryobacterium shii]TFC89805.1 radical SAM protein [Cryobacterium sp. TmT2-59]TFD16290.1 radical SAM protein [Cryobacterium sp. TMT4-10]TFD17424.1 radical SAM protein [Cryobacterium sp. TMT1-21]TFD17766.1 radical SAM protein [Cryobacterium sp. TMT2-23]
MRWSGQELTTEQAGALPGLARLNNLVRSVRTPEFAGITFHEVLAKSALNRVPGQSAMPFGWTINPYRGCSHACTYCFARPTHTYLDLDAGTDFDNEIIVKVNVAEVLQRELKKPTWGRHPVALGTNTDPYQRAEGRYRLMPGVIAALAQSGTPLSILTKGTLLRRDLDLLVEASELVPVDLALSIAIYDDELQQAVEPGTPSTVARLATVTAVRERGLDCSVFMMPILPFLTDTKAHLDEALRQAKDAGASSIMYTALHLRPGVRDWYLQWLARDHPELLPRYLELYAKGAYAPKDYRVWLAARIKPLIKAHGLQRGLEDPSTGGVRSTALGRPATPGRGTGLAGSGAGAGRGTRSGAGRDSANTAVRRSLIAEELPPELSPTLF